jgi:hypothetical protein
LIVPNIYSPGRLAAVRKKIISMDERKSSSAHVSNQLCHRHSFSSHIVLSLGWSTKYQGSYSIFRRNFKSRPFHTKPRKSEKEPTSNLPHESFVFPKYF